MFQGTRQSDFFRRTSYFVEHANGQKVCTYNVVFIRNNFSLKMGLNKLTDSDLLVEFR